MLPQLTAEQVHAALPWPVLAAALEAAFMAPPVAPVRTAHALSPSDTLLFMPAWNDRAIGLKLVTVIPSAPRHGGHTVDASYLLLDRFTGAPRALMDGEALTVRRTAAASALAARALAVPQPQSLLVVGTGRLAPWMLRAYRALLPSLTRLQLWGRDAATTARLAQSLLDEGVPVSPAPSLPDAVASSQIVCCVTTATAPVVHGDWVRAGTHLDLVGGFTPGMREVDDAAVARARIVVDSLDSALREAGDLVQPLERGVITRASLVGDLGMVLRGEVIARRSDRDITLFKSVGHALEDLAAATVVFDQSIPAAP
ncbi:ornithine cyclodeaminase family protein [Gemmatimonas sp.]|uniref:ornithine cyclodeaminase family protein n=1 Tax=Gemmatimonas sp. TaxID=1962908 RepID=UPI0037BF4619